MARSNRRNLSHVLAAREYVSEARAFPEGQKNDAPLLLRIVEDHDAMALLPSVLELLHAKGYFRPPQELLEGHPSEKIKVGAFEYLRDHGNTPNPIGLAQIADFHGIRSKVLANVLASFKLNVPGRLPPVLRDEQQTGWRGKPR